MDFPNKIVALALALLGESADKLNKFIYWTFWWFLVQSRKCVQPFQVVISTGMSVLRLAFVHIDGDLYHSVLVPRLPQRVFVLNRLDGTRF